MRPIKHRTWIAAIAGMLSAVVAVSCWLYAPKAKPTAKAVDAAQDEVYEAVVRDAFEPSDGHSGASQLVFDEMAIGEPGAAQGDKSCEENFRRQVGLGQPPVFNSVADKFYRLVTRGGWDDGAIRGETLQDYVRKSCNGGQLSKTFRTDLPRTFVSHGKVHFAGWPLEKDESQSFAKLFPGAVGIISFSRVGFDTSLDEAVIGTSFVCGGLCGTGWRYFLKKRRGKWEVTDKVMVWVS